MTYVEKEGTPNGEAEAEAAGDERDRGRDACSPLGIPWRGWQDVLLRVYDEAVDDRVTSRAAAVAFFGVLAVFPALIATVSLFGLLADPAILKKQVLELSVALPWSVRSLLVHELSEISRRSPESLGVGAVLSIGASLLSASSGTSALLEAVNLAYDEQETRGFLVRRWLALRFAIGISLFTCLAAASTTFVPALMTHVGLGSEARAALEVLRWPALALAVMVGLSFLYRYAPNRTPPRWPWVSVGASFATAVWLAGSFALSFYAGRFVDYNKTYGALAGVILMMVWFYVSSLAVVLGAELNAELEHQTRVDTTVGDPAPMGMRCAVMADTLGLAPQPQARSSLYERVRSLLREVVAPRRRKSDTKRSAIERER